MSEREECRGEIWPNLIKEAAELRQRRKEIEEREKEIKDALKEQMKSRGISEWVTLSGHLAVLNISPSRGRWNQKLLMEDLNVDKKELNRYKKFGSDIYSLTTYLPK